MNRHPTQPLFEFESADSLAQFSIWIVPVAGGGIISVFAWELGGWLAIAAVIALCLVVVAGLRSRIAIYPGQVQLVKKWWFVPYRTYVAESIEDVSYGGDWGLEDGAVGVVVKMGGREVHLGTSKNMRYLHDALSRAAFSATNPASSA